jgi:archaellum biogenesis protein FlaJ (TadC family)
MDTLQSLLRWLEAHPEVLGWLGLGSLAAFVVTLLALPVLVARLPRDYFHHRHREHDYNRDNDPGAHYILVVFKNLLGFLIVLAGVAMLVLPGQGLLTILIGLVVMDFPGKYALERRLVSYPSVFRGANWLRLKMGKEPLAPPL